MHWFSKVLKVALPKFRKNRVSCTSRQLVSHYIYCLSFFFPSPTYLFPSILNSSVFNIHGLLASLFLLRFQNNWSNVYLPLFLLLIFLWLHLHFIASLAFISALLNSVLRDFQKTQSRTLFGSIVRLQTFLSLFFLFNVTSFSKTASSLVKGVLSVCICFLTLEGASHVSWPCLLFNLEVPKCSRV